MSIWPIKRIAVAGFVHETNTFAPFPTRLADFDSSAGGAMLVGDEVLNRTPNRISLRGFADAARQAGHELIGLVYAAAQPASRLERDCFEHIVDKILRALDRGPVPDAIFLELHGAMVADHVDDADTQILARVRAKVGADIPIVVSLDSHGNVSKALVDLADGIAAYRTYPHVDMWETGVRAYQLLAPLLRGEPRYASAFKAIPFLMPIHRQTTMMEPCRSLYAALEVLEAECGEGACLSFMTGFSLADVPQCRPCVFGYGRDKANVERALSHLHARIIQSEPAFKVDLIDHEAAMSKALSLQSVGPIVLADVQDNAGGGATSDTVWILDALMRAHVDAAAVGLLFDPETAAAAHEAGEGAERVFRLGGKGMPGHTPLTATFRIERLYDGPFALKGPMLGGTQANLGKMAQLRYGGIRIVVTSQRSWYVEREHFRVVGVNPEDSRIVVVKSTNHYRADFAPIAGHIIEFAAPGAVTLDPSKLDYRKLQPGVRLFGDGPPHGGPTLSNISNIE